MVTKTTPDPSVVAAEKRCTKAHSNLTTFQKTIIEIIKAKDWETLGYDSFAKYWVDRFSDITLALELRPHVIYELLREGADIDDIANVVKGVSPDGVATFKQKRDAGVPPEVATNKTSKKRRNRGRDVVTVFIPLNPQHKARWDAAAAQHNMSLVEFVIGTVDGAV